MLQKVFQIWHVLTPFSTSEREAVKTNARWTGWNPVTFSSKQQQAGWSTSSQARERRKISPPSSTTDFTHSVFHRCEFWDWNTFLSSQVFEQFVGIYEPNASFWSKGRYESKFTGQLVKFRPITVEIKLVKPIKFTFTSSRQSRAHSPPDHHWLFYHVYALIAKKINGRVIKWINPFPACWYIGW